MQAVAEAPARARTSPLDPQQLFSRPAPPPRRPLDRGGPVDTICKQKGKIKRVLGAHTAPLPPPATPCSEMVAGLFPSLHPCSGVWEGFGVLVLPSPVPVPPLDVSALSPGHFVQEQRGFGQLGLVVMWVRVWDPQTVPTAWGQGWSWPRGAALSPSQLIQPGNACAAGMDTQKPHRSLLAAPSPQSPSQQGCIQPQPRAQQ